MKRKEMMKQIIDDIREQMFQCLLADMDRMYFEQDYGNGVVQVDLYEVCGTPYEITDVQCYVLHFDGKERHSPCLEAAIIEKMPDWFEMKHQLNERQSA
jgi:hypothetical protein